LYADNIAQRVRIRGQIDPGDTRIAQPPVKKLVEVGGLVRTVKMPYPYMADTGNKAAPRVERKRGLAGKSGKIGLIKFNSLHTKELYQGTSQGARHKLEIIRGMYIVSGNTVAVKITEVNKAIFDNTGWPSYMPI
jgi:hypothetical protein